MEQNIEDFVFTEHFNPNREPGLTFKGCPFCRSNIYTLIKDKHVCFRCGKTWEDKKNGN